MTVVLGIDTSCDDTAAGVVEDGRRVRASVIHSQVRVHHPYGGVVPELASREHIRNILPVVFQALDRAGLTLSDLDGIAVTVGPGLVGSLLVGLYYAKGMAWARGLPLVGVNHLEGHLLSIFLEEEVPRPPFVALTVSGGHTHLVAVPEIGRYVLMGQTLDDAAGEAFDKAAKILGLGYPGGVAIEKLAAKGDARRIRFPRATLSRDSLDFSFSGLKTAVALYVKRWQAAGEADATAADIAASFQEAVVDVLVDKTWKAAAQVGVRDVVVAGGVACNSRLREKMRERASTRGNRVLFPRKAYCTDNGAMIAAAGYHRLGGDPRAALRLDVRSRYPIEDLEPLA